MPGYTSYTRLHFSAHPSTLGQRPTEIFNLCSKAIGSAHNSLQIGNIGGKRITLRTQNLDLRIKCFLLGVHQVDHGSKFGGECITIKVIYKFYYFGSKSKRFRYSGSQTNHILPQLPEMNQLEVSEQLSIKPLLSYDTETYILTSAAKDPRFFTSSKRKRLSTNSCLTS